MTFVLSSATMTFVLSSAAILLLAATALGDNNPDGWVTDAPATFTDAQKRILVEKHNHYRRMENSSDMMRLEWDDDLAVFAQNVADRCKFGHTENSERRNLGVHANAGENIYASSASGFMAQEVVRGWWSEIEDYTFDTQACTEGKMCGHYTQVVWAASKALGCGVSRCDTLENVPASWGPTYVVFCVYGPAGNYNGRKPFTKGATCTKCPKGANECGDGLCSPKAGNTAPVRQEYTSANEFCQARQGPDSFACLKKSLYNNRAPEGDVICKQVYCAKNGNPEDCAYEFASYTDGLPCDAGKVCHHGVCEMDVTGGHDDIQQNCVHGDQGKIYGPTTGGIVTCDAEIAKDGSAACKADTFGRLCCASCAGVLEDADPNCPFGDEFGPGWCAQYSSWICGCPTWSKSCCDFCKNRK